MGIDRRISKTNSAILDAFITLAKTTPLDKITVTALAKQANISRKTFYDRYSGINELISNLQQYMAEKFQNIFIPSIDQSNIVGPTYIHEFLTFAKNNSELISLLKQDYHDFLKITIERQKDDFIDYLEKQENFTPEKAQTIAPWMISFYFKGTTYIVDEWLFTDNDLTEKDVEKLINILFRDSIFNYEKNR